MSGEQIALWLGIAAVAIGTIGTVVRVTLGMVRAVRRRRMRRRTQRVQEAVRPLFVEQETQLAAIRINQGELSDAVGVTIQRVAALEDAITNGLTSDLAEMKDEQARQGDRIDRIFDHLIT